MKSDDMKKVDKFFKDITVEKFEAICAKYNPSVITSCNQAYIEDMAIPDSLTTITECDYGTNALQNRIDELENMIELLKLSLKKYKHKWELELDEIKRMNNSAFDKEIVKLNSMNFLAQWIINSINGGLNKPHGTNICKIVLCEKNNKGVDL